MRRPLWRCPKCGHRFVTRNLWHSCGRYDLAHHFEGCDPIVKKLYGRFVKILRACGPVTIYPQKTRIVAMVDVRFANATTTKRALRVHLWLKRRVQHPALVRHDDYGRLGFGNTFKLERLDQLDGELEALVREAYARDQA
jgi:hypothetical protein